MKELEECFIDPVIDYVAEFCHVESKDLKTRSRKREVVLARMLASYSMLYLGFSTILIGELINRDHSSIQHYKKLYRYDSLFNDYLYRFTIFMADKGIIIPGYDRWKVRLCSRNQIKK